MDGGDNVDDLICDKDAVLGLSLSIRRHRLFIYQSTIKALGKPEYIRLLFNPNQNKFATQSCDGYDKD